MFALALIVTLLGSTPSAQPHPTPTPTASPTPGPAWSGLQWRSIGPAAPGGRVAAVAGTAQDPNLYYLGSAGGGVWRSRDGGETWQFVFQKEPIGAIGAVEIDPTNENVVWAGTGEANPRNDVSYGDGIYKSSDGGKTWTNMGLRGTRHIARIAIDPKDPNHVIVAALGNVFGPSTDRGIYVTNDGGKSWKKTLYVSDQSGGSDVAIDPSDPSVVYAGMWHFQRIPWNFTSGGADDGLYKSTDGGMTWTRLSGHGLPGGITGRIGLAIAPSDPNWVYALIGSAHGILWRSQDAGATWQLVSSDTIADQRPFYFSHIAVDPKDTKKVYAVSEELALSTDGGKKFTRIARGVHVDYHAIWIAPNDPNRIIVGEDGGIARTVDSGKHWFFGRNLPVGEVYHVAASNENPYWVCGGWQDNDAWCGPSNSLDPEGILDSKWIDVNGGDGEWAVPDPIDPNWIWADTQTGALQIFNKKTGDAINAQPFFATQAAQFDLARAKYRFNWDSPVAFAPWDGHIGWIGANVVFQTADRGIHWKVISPDLTLDRKSHQQPSGGPIVHDVSGAEYSDTILDIEGSRARRGEIWVGTDDGLVWRTLDGGTHWKNVTPPGVPPYGRVETVAPSPLHDGTVYVSIDRHRSDDFKPYLFVSNDFGAHWRSIVSNLPADQYVRAVRPDIRNAQIVYAGTENGLWISFDGGARWNDFRNGIPHVSVRDIRFQRQWDDLIVATHGHALYIMDDVRAIQDLPSAIAAGEMFFAPRTSYEYNSQSGNEGRYDEYAAKNPPTGEMLTFYQHSASKKAPVVHILDAAGRTVRTIDGKDANKTGINRIVWDFGADGPVKWLGAGNKRFQGSSHGPQLPPGRYTARLTLGSKTFTRSFTVKADPRSRISQDELVAAYALQSQWEGRFSNVDRMLNGLDAIKRQLDEVKSPALAARVKTVRAQRDALFHELTADYHNDEDSIEYPGELREEVQSVLYTLSAPLTPAMRSLAARILPRYERDVQRYNAFVSSIAPLAKSVGEKAPPAIR